MADGFARMGREELSRPSVAAYETAAQYHPLHSLIIDRGGLKFAVVLPLATPTHETPGL